MNRVYLSTLVACLAIVVLFASSASAQHLDSLGGTQIHISKSINTDIQSEPLNYLVNTPYKEFGPMPTKDDKRLYFSRQGFPGNTGGAEDEDIWYCEFDEESQLWSQAINIGPPLNNAGPNFITGIGTNGDTLLLGNVYLKNGRMKAGLSVSILQKDGVWSFPVPVNIAADYNISGRASYDLSTDRSKLIIAQEKADSNGKLDLYVAFRSTKGKGPYTGTESINLGPVINTFGDETSPWLSYDNETLYFSSDGHNGYGKLDIFMSKRLDDTWTNWSVPENLGPGINSQFEDMSFNYNPKSRYAYYSRGLNSSNSDIYRIDMTRLFKEAGDATDGRPEIGETQVVANVFDENKPTIRKDAEDDLEKVVENLKKYPTMAIQISAHSNKHATRVESLKLSNQRVTNVQDFLVKKGIDKKRLTLLGLGHDIVINSRAQSNSKDRIDIATSAEFKVVSY